MAKYTRVIVDAMNLAHRAFHTTARGLNAAEADDFGNQAQLIAPTMPPLENGAPYPTGVLWVCTMFYLNLLRRWIPDQVIFVWDGNRNLTWRKKVYPLYKSNRDKEMLEDEIERRNIFASIECRDVRQMVQGFGGINLFAPDGYEADDVISFLTRKLTCAENTTDIIISNDSDLIQLVRAHACRLFNPSRESLWFQRDDGQIQETNEKKAESSVQFLRPITALIYKTLVGDASDCLPGVKGVGAVAAQLLAHAITLSDPRVQKNIVALFDCDPSHESLMRAASELGPDKYNKVINRALSAFTKARTDLASNGGRADLIVSAKLSDLHTAFYNGIEAQQQAALRAITKSYAMQMKQRRQETTPLFSRDVEQPLCNFSKWFGRRGFAMAFDDERREEAGIRVAELHRRHCRYISRISQHAKQSWKGFM